MISDAEKEKILKGIWNGSITVNTLPNDVYVENKDKLIDGVNNGFGTTLSTLTPGTSQAVMMDSLYGNVTFFSAAKTFQQVNDMSFLKYDEAGFIKSFSDFKADAGKVFDTYNKDWLETEFNTSIQQSQSAEQWLSIQDQKAELPLLKYQTAADERVRDDHAAWDNIIRPVDDPFWNSHMPSNGYNCRCTVIQIPSGQVSSLTGVKKNTNSLFADNVGKSEQVFQETGSDKHPYFSVEKKYDKLKSDNFGLSE